MTITVTSIPTTGTVLVGATRQYAIEVRDQNNAVLGGQSATWSIVGGGGIATIGTGGLATCVAVGTATVHAVGPLNGSGVNLTADASLQCVAAPVLVPTTMTIVVTSTPATGTVLVAATRQYAVEVRDQNNAVLTGQTAAWSMVTAGIATITPAGGLATCAAVGTGTVHAVGPLNGSGVNLTADASLQCVAPVPVPTTMTIVVTSTPATGTVLVGATRQYAVEVRDQNNAVLTGQTAAWSMVTAGIATITPAGGLATCVAVGTGTVHAVGPLNGAGVNLTADASLQCAAPVPVPTTMTILITSAPTTGSVLVGTTRQYAIDVRDQFNAVVTGQTATWSIVGAGGIATITPTGGLATCAAVGTVTVHAVGPLNGLGVNLTADASLQCIASSGNPAVVIVLTPSTVTVTVSALGNGTATTTATFLDAGGQLTSNGCPVGFATDSSSIASVASTGLTATVTAHGAGTTILRAYCTSGANITSLARVQVTSAPLNVAKVVMATRYVYFPASTQSSTFQFVATALDVNGVAVPAAPMTFTVTNTGGVASGPASIDQSGTVTVAAAGAGGPFRGGAVLTATSGGQKEFGFVTYGDAGTIRGQVSSTTGQYVGGTTATATNSVTGVVSSAGGVTNDGYFYIVGLIAGTYTVNVTGAASGQLQTFTGVVVTSGQQTVVTMTPFAQRLRY